MQNIYKCRVCGEYTESPIHCGVKSELILDAKRRVMLSKLMSGLLRHYPQEAGLKLDSEGWVSIDELSMGIREKWRNKELYQWVTREHIIAIAMLDPKNRFEIKNNKIRARYGHSIDVEIKYLKINYNGKLYHGTSIDKLDMILVEGIRSMKRKYVHLTTDIVNAREIGRRHGKPVVLIINSRCLEENNIEVYKATDKIYLVKYVPPKCIDKILH
ncbi:MAG: RNA 2'-phosphotransferase [Desulfurococcales archaeon ex4484_58]|nr:MAG: RNA 2'-phosphotransferase [Desulfurococcales archaeon ex4484_58]